MIAARAGLSLLAAALFAVDGARAQPTIELSEERLMSANAVTSSLRTATTLARIEFDDAFEGFDLSAEAAAVPRRSAAFAQFLEDPATPRARDALVASLENAHSADALSAKAWFALAVDAARRTDLDAMNLHAQRALDAASTINNRQAMANALMLRGMVFLFSNGGSPSQDYLDQSAEHFAEAMASIPADAPESEAFVWRAYAWLLAASHSARTLGYRDFRKRNPGAFSIARKRASLGASDRQCGLKWKKVSTGVYPKKMRGTGESGVAVVGFDLTDSLKTTNVRVLAVIPDDLFAEIALRTVSDGKMKRTGAARSDASDCLTNKVSVLYFDRHGRFFDAPDE